MLGYVLIPISFLSHTRHVTESLALFVQDATTPDCEDRSNVLKNTKIYIGACCYRCRRMYQGLTRDAHDTGQQTS